MRARARATRGLTAAAAAYVLALAGGCGGGGRAVEADCPPCVQAPCPGAAAEAPREVAPPLEADPASVSTERARKLSLVAFSEDGDLYALRVEDEMIGLLFEVRELRKDTPVAVVPFDRDREAATWRAVRRKHGLTVEPGPSQQQPGGDLVLAGADDEEHAVVYVLKGDRAAPYFLVPRLGAEDLRPARVTWGRMAWDPTGRSAVVLHTQALDQPLPFEGDFAHSFRVQGFRLPFGGD